MSVMVQFSNPTYCGLKEPDPNPVTLGPYQEIRVEDCGVYGDHEAGSDALAYWSTDGNAWIHNLKEYGEMKIFASPSVVSA